MAKQTQEEYMKMQRQFARESGSKTFIAPPGTDTLPLAERLHIYLEVFESGCSNTQPPIGSGKPEECPEHVRAFVEAVRKAVDEEIEANPLEAVLRMARATTGACPACGGEDGAHKEGCRQFLPNSDVRAYARPAQKPPKCPECGCVGTNNHLQGCPNSFPK